jgi:nucleoside-diphosphate-sugar epimerase
MYRLSDLILLDAKNVCQKLDLHELRGKKVLLTGASGLMGVHFLACLKLLSNEFSGNLQVFTVMQSTPLDFIKNLLDFKNTTILQGDITDQNFLNSLPEADYIIHAAGYGQPGRFMENQEKTLKLNTVATFSLLEKLLQNGKFLFVSTSEVYSGLTKPPHKETEIGTTNTTHPRSCYIEAKRCGEAICNAYRTKGVQAKSARLSLAYGPGTRQNDMRVINSFIQKALVHGSINLMDQGLANRTYCYVSDAIEIMWRILLDGKEPIYNVGGFSKITIAELAKQIGRYLNVPICFPEKSGTMVGAPDDVFLDMELVKKEFGKKDFVNFTEGLTNTIEWQKILYER